MRCIALTLSLVAVTAHAQDKPAEMPAPKPGWTVIDSGPDLPGIEPRIERLVQEDRNARVDELRVRGEVKKVKVHPKIIPAPDYEIIVGDASSEPVAGPSGLHGAIGQRVWQVIEF